MGKGRGGVSEGTWIHSGYVRLCQLDRTWSSTTECPFTFVNYSAIQIIFCRHILLCNLLTTILRPNFEEPLDTAKQLVEKNITLYDGPGFEIWKQFLQESPTSEYNKLGDIYLLADDWDHFSNLSKLVISTGKYALMTGGIYEAETSLGRWYRSEEKVAGKYPYGGYLTTKKWHLNEVMPQH